MANLGAIGVRANKVVPALSFDTAAKKDQIAESSRIGYTQGITLGGPTSLLGDNTFTRNLQVGISKNTSDGSSAQPSLRISTPGGFWRFRWVVKSGSRTISVSCKQAINGNPRPSVIVKANPDVGLNSDLNSSAPSGTGWVSIGPITFTATATGVVWVELHNNYMLDQSDALFDHIVVL